MPKGGVPFLRIRERGHAILARDDGTLRECSAGSGGIVTRVAPIA
jgi:hypothetical protein